MLPWINTEFMECPPRAKGSLISQEQHKSAPVGAKQNTLSRTLSLGQLRQGAFSSCLIQQGADTFSWKYPVIAAVMSGTFGGQIPWEGVRMLQRVDSSVWNLILLPLFCLSFLYPLPNINLNAFSLHSCFIFFLPACLCSLPS